jgi:hypothetical protein
MIRSPRKTLRVRRAHSSKTATSGAASARGDSCSKACAGQPPASSVGNQGIKASSRAAAEEAAEKWVGEGARPIFREGQQIGWESADGTKVVRFTSAGKPDPYINLTNKTTGGNLHVHF